MLKSFLSGAAVLLLTAGVAAQNHVSVKKIDVPIQYVGTYHMATDSWTGAQRVGMHVLYNATTPGNYYSNVGNSFATNSGHLWVDEGDLLDTNDGRVTNVSGFDFAYCSTDLDPTGNGGAVLVAFYDDHGSCATGETATCAYVLSGLPLSTTGNTACWAVGVDLGGGFECTTETTTQFRTRTNPSKANPAFGWAFGANPGQTGRNNTGPILDLPCPQPLQGCPTPDTEGLQGNENFFAWEDPAGVWTGCYWFGGVPWASFSMRMYAGSNGPNSLAYYGGAGTTNANLLTASTAYVPGPGTGVPPLTVTSTTSTGGAGVYLLAAAAPGNLNLAQGTVLVNTNFLVNPLPMPGGTASVQVPLAVPRQVYLQAVETTGPATVNALRELSNALQMQVGVTAGVSTDYPTRNGRNSYVTNAGPGNATVTYTAPGGATVTATVLPGTSFCFTTAKGSTFTVTVPPGATVRVLPC